MAGVVLFHELVHTSVFADGFPRLSAEQSPAALNGIALLFVLAAMGKSAMLPFTGWLPRAMEGPTPSSAIFYGALSIHAGPFLLLRLAPLLEAAPALPDLPPRPPKVLVDDTTGGNTKPYRPEASKALITR